MSILDWNLGSTRYAVLDLETTGLSPGNDRVIEVSVHHYEPGGVPRLVLSTLVNPRRRVAGTEIHGITDADVRDAPFFEDVAPAIAAALAGRVVASHNVYFDHRFISMELERVGRRAEFPYLCTMYLRPMLGLGKRASLAESCAAHDIPVAATHDAASDGWLAACLLAAYLGSCAALGVRTFAELAARKAYKFVESFRMSPLGDGVVPLPPTTHASRPKEQSRRDANNPALRDYVERLLVAIADFDLSAEEAADLRRIASEGRLSPAELRAAHTHVFEAALEQAPSAGDIERFFEALGLVWTFATDDVGPGLAALGDLFALTDEQRPEDWIEDHLADLRVWSEPLPSTDARAPLLARQLEDIRTAQLRSRFSLDLAWEKPVAELLGPRPKAAGGAPPAQADPREVTRRAVADLGFLTRILPWRAGVRRAARDRALDDARATFLRAEQTWNDERRRADEAIAAWDERRRSYLQTITLQSSLGRAWFFRELEGLDALNPIRCAVEDSGGRAYRISLVLPARDDVPGTAVQLTKAGRPSIVRAPAGDREMRWEALCKLVGTRVALAALNAFPAIDAVELIGYAPASRAPILELRAERAGLTKAGELDFDKLARRWSPADDVAVKARNVASKSSGQVEPAADAPRRGRPRKKPAAEDPRGADAAALAGAEAYDRNQAGIIAASKPRLAVRAVQELMGMAAAVCLDDRIDADEIGLLRGWLSGNAHLRDTWPVDRVAAVLDDIVADGVVTDAEAMALLAVLRDLRSEYDTEVHAPEDIFDSVPIVFEARSFVLTGRLRLSKRAPFVERLLALGAQVQSDVAASTDYLVVGLDGSEAWVTGRYGTKIEKAMRMKRERGAPIAIVREGDAVEALLRAGARRQEVA